MGTLSALELGVSSPLKYEFGNKVNHLYPENLVSLVAEQLSNLGLVSGEEQVPVDPGPGGRDLPGEEGEAGGLHLPLVNPLSRTGGGQVSSVNPSLGRDHNKAGYMYVSVITDLNTMLDSSILPDVGHHLSDSAELPGGRGEPVPGRGGELVTGAALRVVLALQAEDHAPAVPLQVYHHTLGHTAELQPHPGLQSPVNVHLLLLTDHHKAFIVRTGSEVLQTEASIISHHSLQQ